MNELDRTIVVGVDYSDQAISAVDEALRSATSVPGGRLVPVLVLSGGPITGRLEEGPEMTNEVIERSRENLFQLVATRARALGLTPPRIEPRVRFGAPAEQLLAQASESRAALIVVGTHGRRGLEHLLLGSVAEEVTRQATCSVLVARSAARVADAAATIAPAVRAAVTEGTAPPSSARAEDASTVVREPHIDAGRVVLHVLDAPTGQVFACGFEDLTTVSVDPVEGGWVPAPSSEARARVGRIALRTAAREHSTFDELFQEIGRRQAARTHQR
jgi:nucleotide-binding universal stress UspA family protein